MRRYLIILTALLAAVLVMSLIKAWQRRRAIARGEDLESLKGISWAHLIGAIVGMIVFFVGALWVESNAAGPGSAYQPAQLDGGKVTSGGFDTDDK